MFGDGLRVGSDTILDFDPGSPISPTQDSSSIDPTDLAGADGVSVRTGDIIDLSRVAGVSGLDDLSLSQVGNDAVITLFNGTITLVGIDVGQLDSSDFLF